jgi:hypothetical protein
LAKLQIQLNYLNNVPNIANLLRNVKDKKEIKRVFNIAAKPAQTCHKTEHLIVTTIVLQFSLSQLNFDKLNSIKATKSPSLPRNIFGEKIN